MNRVSGPPPPPAPLQPLEWKYCSTARAAVSVPQSRKIYVSFFSSTPWRLNKQSRGSEAIPQYQAANAPPHFCMWARTSLCAWPVVIAELINKPHHVELGQKGRRETDGRTMLQPEQLSFRAANLDPRDRGDDTIYCYVTPSLGRISLGTAWGWCLQHRPLFCSLRDASQNSRCIADSRI